MNQQDLNYFKQVLLKKKTDLEGQLSRLADKNPTMKGDYRARFNTAGEDMEDEATDTESYINDLPVEHELEITLKYVNEALVRIEAGTYGKSIESGVDIEIERLRTIPETPYTKEEEEAHERSTR